MNCQQSETFSNKSFQDEHIEIILMYELFEVLQGHAGLDHPRILQEISFALTAWVKESSRNAIRAVELMHLIGGLYGCLGRHMDLIIDKSNYYTKLSEETNQVS